MTAFDLGSGGQGGDGGDGGSGGVGYGPGGKEEFRNLKYFITFCMMTSFGN